MDRVIPTVLDRPLDNTAIAAFNRCNYLYDISMRQDRRPAGPPSPALAYGKLWHTIMEWHYRTHGNHAEVFLRAHEAGIDHDHPDDYRTVDRALLEYTNYCKKYGPPEKEKYKTLGFPHEPFIELATNVEAPELAYPYAVKIDRIIEHDGEYFIEDYKTSSRWESDYFRQYKTSNQMRGYCFAASKLIGKPIAGARINLLVTRKNDSQFETEILRYLPWQMDEWLENYNATVKRLRQSYEENHFVRNFTDGGCKGKYGMCTYFGLCTIRPQLREQVIERDFPVNPWNPLEAEDYFTD